LKTTQAPTHAPDAGVLAALLRPTGETPLHSQLEAGIRHLIRSGVIRAGSILPGELDLAAGLGLSRHTVRHALSALAAEGLLRRERGRGTLVLPPAVQAVTERSLSSFYAFAWEVSARGMEQQSHILEFATVAAPSDIAERLALGANREVKRIVRIRTAGGEPLIIETAYLPAALAECLTTEVLARGSVYDELERHHGLRVTMAQEKIAATVLSRKLARLLAVPVGSPAFKVERTTWSDRGPIEWQESLVRGDRFLYSVELPRGDVNVDNATFGSARTG
jgi:GntR family transcriptional regulator